jgi:hypothetical protein
VAAAVAVAVATALRATTARHHHTGLGTEPPHNTQPSSLGTCLVITIDMLLLRVLTVASSSPGTVTATNLLLVVLFLLLPEALLLRDRLLPHRIYRSW